jgi:AraC-like DNA-binding protein
MGTIPAALNNVLFISLFILLLFHAFIFLSNPFKVNLKGNFWLGLFFTVWASFYLDEVAAAGFNYVFPDRISLFIRMIQYFSPMLFYFSMMQFSNPGKKITNDLFWHLIPALIYQAILLSYSFSADKSHALRVALLIFYLIQSAVYISLTFYTFYRHQKVINVYSSNKEFVDLKWLLRLIWGIAIVLFIIVIYNLVSPFDAPNLFVNFLIILVICDFSYNAIRQKEIFPRLENASQEIIELNEELEQNETRNKLISDQEMVELKIRLNNFLIEEQPYLDSDITLVGLAELLHTTAHKLSYTINAGFDMNFFNFINQFRVEHAKKLLKDPDKQHLSLLGIAFESGFSSKTAFNTSFKKITGLTPSEFKKSGSML